MDTKGIDVEKFEGMARATVIEALFVIQPYLLGQRRAMAEVKATDRSFLTEVDTAVSELMRRRIGGCFPGVDHNVEDDAAGPTSFGSRFKIWGDPVDGTLPFTLGAPTSTVIMGLHDTVTKKVLACVIGDPALRRIWYTHDGRAHCALVAEESAEVFERRKICVWDGVFSRDTAVFLDNPRGFVRGPEKRPILSDEEIGRLIEKLRTSGRLQLYGSNGLYHALVAQGGEHDKVAGGITSAMGGCQDVMGVKLILDAGGAARAFTARDGGFDEKNPEAIEQYDILVYGNNPETVDRLSDMVVGLRR